MGYSNVKVFMDGFPKWKETAEYYSVEVACVQDILTNLTPAVIIDSRPAKPKYVQGHIPGAVSIPDAHFDTKKGILPIDKSIPLIFYCGGYECKLSHLSAKKAAKLGYSHIAVFPGGYPAWKKAGDAGALVATDPPVGDGTIGVDEFKVIMNTNPDSILLIDVRSKEEYAAGHIKNAVHMSVDMLEKNAKNLKQDKRIIFVCSTGARSGEAYYMMQDLRPDMKNVSYLDARVTYKKDGSFTINPH